MRYAERKRLRTKRLHLNKNTIEQAAGQVATQMAHLSQFLDSKSIAFYLSQENEVDTRPSMQYAIDSDKQLFLPVILSSDDKVLSFYSYHPNDKLIRNCYNIFEPDTNTQTAIERTNLDIIVTPLVAFDSDCNRLGRGAGYYDHTLSFINETSGKRPMLIGFGYEFQKITKIEPSIWDIPLDCVITEERIYQRA